jgi:hypothetical protein
MEITIYTALVGLGLLACGYYLGVRNSQKQMEIIIAFTLRQFINELIENRVVTHKKIENYILKNYGTEIAELRNKRNTR